MWILPCAEPQGVKVRIWGAIVDFEWIWGKVELLGLYEFCKNCVTVILSHCVYFIFLCFKQKKILTDLINFQIKLIINTFKFFT